MSNSTMDSTYKRLEHDYNQLLDSYNKLLNTYSTLRKVSYGFAFFALCGGGIFVLCLYCWMKARRQTEKVEHSTNGNLGRRVGPRHRGDELGGVELQPLSSLGRAVVRGEERDEMERGLLPRYHASTTAPRYSTNDPHTQRPETPWTMI